jgi:flagellar basal body-associated protein FliL
MSEYCSQDVEDMNKNFKTNKESGGPSVVTITLIVIGVLLVCAVGGAVIWVSVVKGRRDRPKMLENSYDYPSFHVYDDVVAVPSYVSVQSDTDVDSDSRNATGYSYAAVQ